jgi:DNA-binding transcriptional ArsR family regulator
MNLRRDVFQAISDPTRRAILLLLTSQTLSARPTVSRHLQILTECELLKQKQTGREVFYELNPHKIKELADFIEPFRKTWGDRFNKLETVMKNYQNK